MELQRIAAFSENGKGGNPAGVLMTDVFPSDAEMQRIASEVGYSETVFAVRSGTDWRVRYFSPESEVPFCGHATIALGAALTMQEGPGVFALTTNDVRITVEGGDGAMSCSPRFNLRQPAVRPPPTKSSERSWICSATPLATRTSTYRPLWPTVELTISYLS